VLAALVIAGCHVSVREGAVAWLYPERLLFSGTEQVLAKKQKDFEVRPPASNLPPVNVNLFKLV
jgi:hypothetical protein